MALVKPELVHMIYYTSAEETRTIIISICCKGSYSKVFLCMQWVHSSVNDLKFNSSLFDVHCSIYKLNHQRNGHWNGYFQSNVSGWEESVRHSGKMSSTWETDVGCTFPTCQLGVEDVHLRFGSVQARFGAIAPNFSHIKTMIFVIIVRFMRRSIFVNRFT